MALATPLEERAGALAKRAKGASAALAAAGTAAKDRVLHVAADALSGERGRRVLAENQADLDLARGGGLAGPLLERLRLDEQRLAELARALREVAALPDPVGRIDALAPRPSGIHVGRMQVPLGVVLMVYESRPNVTLDAAALALKAGNAVILRGGKEALGTNRALAALLHHALNEAGLPADAAVFVDDPDHELLYALLRQRDAIDVAIPRGGTALIDAVNQHARMPVIQHYQGICHVYVHAHADLTMATRIAVNAKVQRPGVCNAMECLVVDQAVAPALLPRVVAELAAHGVLLRGCERTRALAPQVAPALPADFDTEFLALTCAIKVVDDIDDALAFLRAHGSRHTEAIVTNDHAAAMRFLREVDASCVMVNASTRFNDGGELGLGAELGISTTKLHAYGPMGLEELCAKKFVVLGRGETRGSPP
ncbi:MAG: glutamate-5-semialdehyde dehydrogenase [Deltaproteobacteria bacterium]|nr:glutamate-5-semialdehyde dehydrogenase [Deltaproteobacteria bacterium]